MEQLFICPDCRAIHAEPAEAAYVLEVRCLACALDDHVRAAWASREGRLPATLPALRAA